MQAKTKNELLKSQSPSRNTIGALQAQQRGKNATTTMHKAGDTSD